MQSDDNPELLETNAIGLLLTRASAARLEDPGPDARALDLIFRAALRAPDHGRLRPWRFLVIEGDARARLGELMAAALLRGSPAATEEELARERMKPLRAPLIVVVVARIRENARIPEVEQLLSAGAAAQTVLLAAHGLGYGAIWRTGSPAYDGLVKEGLGLEPGDGIVGFLYIGRAAGAPPPLPRPEPSAFVTHWS